MAYKVTEADAKHYDAIRQARGWSWETLADYFEVTAVDRTALELVKWAREQHKPAARAKKAGTERATKEAPEKR